MAMSLVASIDSADGSRTNAAIDANALYLMSAIRMTRVRLDTFAISHNVAALGNLFSNILQDDNFLYVVSSGSTATLYKYNKSNLTVAASRNIVDDPNTIDYPRTVGIAFNSSKTRIHCFVVHNTGFAATNYWKTEYTTNLTIAAGPVAMVEPITPISVKAFHENDTGFGDHQIIFSVTIGGNGRIGIYTGTAPNPTLTGNSTETNVGGTAHIFTGLNRIIETGGRTSIPSFISNSRVKVWTSVPTSGTDLGLVTTYTEPSGIVAGAIFDDEDLYCFLGVGSRSVRKVLRSNFTSIEFAENIAPGTGSAMEAMALSVDNQFLYVWQSGTPTSRLLKIGGLDITAPVVPVSGGPNIKRRPYPYNSGIISNGGW